jgi:hypothetical protein
VRRRRRHRRPRRQPGALGLRHPRAEQHGDADPDTDTRAYSDPDTGTDDDPDPLCAGDIVPVPVERARLAGNRAPGPGESADDPVDDPGGAGQPSSER